MKEPFTKEKSGALQESKRELEDHLKIIYTDNQRHEQRNIPPDMPSIPQPEHQCDDSPPKRNEVEKAMRRARTVVFPIGCIRTSQMS